MVRVPKPSHKNPGVLGGAESPGRANAVRRPARVHRDDKLTRLRPANFPPLSYLNLHVCAPKTRGRFAAFLRQTNGLSLASI